LNTIPPSFPVFAQPGTAASAARSPSGEPREADPASKAPGSDNKAETAPSKSQAAQPEQGFSPEELKQLTELKARDREVRAHEQAHQAVGGQYAGAISYTFQRGPDGAQYAVGGEVSIDVAPVSGDPQATIEKMRVVRAAALAPAEPSGQDRAVAAEAMQIMLKAQAEVASGEEPSRIGGDQTEPEGSQTPAEGSQSPAEGSQPAAEGSQTLAEGSQSRTGQQAAGTYQSVSAMTGEPQRRSSEFQSVAA